MFSMKINYHPKLKELARKLRNKSTKSEIKRCNEKYGWGFTSNSMLLTGREVLNRVRYGRIQNIKVQSWTIELAGVSRMG